MKKEERDEICGEMGDKEDNGMKRDDEDDGRGMMNDEVNDEVRIKKDGMEKKAVLEEERMIGGESMMTTEDDKHLELGEVKGDDGGVMEDGEKEDEVHEQRDGDGVGTEKNEGVQESVRECKSMRTVRGA